MKRILAAILVLSLLLLVGCGQKDNQPEQEKPLTYTAVTPAEAQKLIAEGKAIVVDVRSAEEYAKSHAEGAINISVGESKPQQLTDTESVIIVYGADAAQSSSAADKLAKLGYSGVRDLGGIADSGLKMVSATQPDGESGGTDGTGGSGETGGTGGSGGSGETGGTGGSGETGGTGGSGGSGETGGTGGSGGSGETGGNPGGNALLSNFSAQDLDGNSVNQSIFSGHKLTMINIWATFCGPCINEMPDLGVLSSEMAASGVRIVGVAVDIADYNGNISDSQLSKAKRIVSQTGANYLHLAPLGLGAITSQARYVPTTFFVDAYGNQVGDPIVGSKSAAVWKDIINERLAQVG